MVLLIDGTQGVEEAGKAVAAALSAAAEMEVAVLVARDGWEQILPLARDDKKALSKAQRVLSTLRGRGGHDNIPGLVHAWDLASEVEHGCVIWVHGPQPVLIESAELLRQRFERDDGQTTLISLQTGSGPNRVIESLDGFRAVRSEIRTGTLGADLEKLVKRLRGEIEQYEIVREQAKAPKGSNVPDNASAGTIASHVARLWAAEETSRLAASRKVEQAMRLAAKYQLVTPVSGAVVLETQAQYAQAELQPVDTQTVPAVPEPSAALLFLLGAGLFAFRKARRIGNHS